MVGGERVHPQREVERLLELLATLAVDALHHLALGRLEVVADRGDVRRVVVVGRQVAADRLEDRRRVLAPGLERELVRPDRLVAERALVRLDPLGDQPPAALGALERAQHVGRGVALERGSQLALALDLLLDLPQVLDRVPVAVLEARLQAAHQPRVLAPAHLRDHRVEVRGGGELGEVEHPVDLPVAVVDVDRVLEVDRHLAHRRRVVVDAVQVLEVALDLGPQPLPPPGQEVARVLGQHPAEVGADRRRVVRVARHARDVAGLVLGRLRMQLGLTRNRRGVDVAVDLLGDPVARERRAEPPEHVVAGQPPAADVEEHRRHRVRDVEVVVDPEELLLALLPLDRELVRPMKSPQDLLGHGHSAPPRPRLSGGRP